MNQRLFVLFAIFIVILNGVGYTQSVDDSRNYALLVAINHYKDDQLNHPPLKYPESDATALREVLLASDYEVDMLAGAQATRSVILAKLQSLRDKSDSSRCVILGFFGHGVEYEASNEAMFLPFDTARRFAVDADGKQLNSSDGSKLTEPRPETLVGMSEVMDAIRLSKAGSKLLLADCCRNNPLASRGTRAFGTGTRVSDIPMNASVIFACSAGEKALENDDWKHGAMTKCLLDLIPEVSEIDSDIAAITGKLRVSVRNLVSKATDGRMTQTVHPITNGVVKLQLKSTKQTASFLSNSAEMERNKSKSNQNTTSTEFWNAKLHPSIEKKLLGSKVWKNADSAADVFQAESGEWISIAVGKHLADANYPRDACSMHAMAKYAEQLSGLTIDAKQKLHNAELTKIIETHAAAHVMPLPPLAEWESEDGKHISVLYGKVLSK